MSETTIESIPQAIELLATWGKRSRRVKVSAEIYARLLTKADDLLIRVQRLMKRDDGTYISDSGMVARIEPRIDFTHWRMRPFRSRSLVIHYR